VHSLQVEAAPERTWAAVVESVSRSLGRGRAVSVALALGCRPAKAAGSPAEVGATLPGFRVAASEPPEAWALRGEHRFSQYSLAFRVDERPGGRSLLSAESRARFPGPAGAAYRAAVIGTRGHVLATRRMLRAAKRRAEQGPADAAGAR
jgi:hypothetical protein